MEHHRFLICYKNSLIKISSVKSNISFRKASVIVLLYRCRILVLLTLWILMHRIPFKADVCIYADSITHVPNKYTNWDITARIEWCIIYTNWRGAEKSWMSIHSGVHGYCPLIFIVFINSKIACSHVDWRANCGAWFVAVLVRSLMFTQRLQPHF